MRLKLFVFPLAVVVSIACGSDSKDPTIDALPQIVPTLEEVRARFRERADEPVEADRGYRENGYISTSEDTPLRDPAPADELEARGRVTGYRADYYIGERNTLRGVEAGVMVVLDLFKDESSAEAEVARVPTDAYRSDVERNIGDESTAWSFELWTSPDGVEAQCPCSLRFRVGRIVGFVRVWYNWPYYGPSDEIDELDPDELALAGGIAQRMRSVLSGS
jgi:hypothetical protein